MVILKKCLIEFFSIWLFRVPKAGSAYIYSYVTVGEFIGRWFFFNFFVNFLVNIGENIFVTAGFIIGWNLILEYAIGTASVARGYSGYLDSLFNKTMASAFETILPMKIKYLSPYPDLCAFAITLFLTLVLSIGVKESTRFNNFFTCLNIGVVIFVTFGGFCKADLKNWHIAEEDLPSEK